MTEKYPIDLMNTLRDKFQKPKVEQAEESSKAELPKVDGRTLRRTGRTEQLAVRVTRETKQAFVEYATRHDLLLAEVFERALEALKKETG